MSDAEDEVEEDPRIAQLYNFASKRYDDDGKYTGEPQEIVDYVAKLGTDKAIVHGSMMLNPAVARAYFIVMALVDADGEDGESGAGSEDASNLEDDEDVVGTTWEARRG